jgi:hypothetical protein
MRTQTAALLVLLAACSSHSRLPRAPQGTPVIEIRGNVIDGPFKLSRADLARLPRRQVRGTDPTTGREAVYEGVSLAPLLIERLQLKKGTDTVVIRTEDRVAVPVPLTVIRLAKPVLADRVDGQPIADPIVAWPTSEQRGLLSDPRTRNWWTRGVVAFDLVNGFATYGRALAVPDGAPPGARLGADLFAPRCFSCHKLRKVGGEKGPDLTRVAERMKAEAFQQLLERHPGWAEPGVERPDEDADRQLWAFLRAVSAQEELGPEEPPLPEEQPPKQPAHPTGGY